MADKPSGRVSADYLEASPRSRRRFLVFFVIVLVAGVAMIELLQAHLERMKTLPLCDQLADLRWLWAGVCLGLAALGIWTGWMAHRSLKLKQWPLPGALIFHRTPIHRGNSAKWRAFALLGYSVLFLGGSGWSWYVIDQWAERAESQRCAER
jgi:hypothetical protein